jgi:undecaprenyl-diphosphatase
MSWLDAIILGLVEGITEFLPISSTGHLILTRSLLGLQGKEVSNALIIIQGAAILAVCWEYRARLWQTIVSLGTQATAQRFAVNLLIAFVIFAIPAWLFGERIEDLLFSALPVAIALVVGGVIILWAEKRKHSEAIATVDEIRPMDAVKIGLFQCLALFPGTSRSAATIIGGLLIGMSRRAATEFSFFIAIPAILAATAYSLWKARHELTITDAGPLALSCVISFIAALVSIRLLLRFVSQHSFVSFAWYRIVLGGIVLAAWGAGLIAA